MRRNINNKLEIYAFPCYDSQNESDDLNNDFNDDGNLFQYFRITHNCEFKKDGTLFIKAI